MSEVFLKLKKKIKKIIFKRKIEKLYLKYKEIINYLIVGGLTTVISLASYYLFVSTILDPNKPIELQIANILSWCCAVAFAYVTNRKYVFESKEKETIKEATKFVSGRLLTLVIDMFLMFLMVTIFKFNDKISKFVVTIIITILNYLIGKFLVFKKN